MRSMTATSSGYSPYGLAPSQCPDSDLKANQKIANRRINLGPFPNFRRIWLTDAGTCRVNFPPDGASTAKRKSSWVASKETAHGRTRP
jgi:hypothetical protein